MFVTIGDVGSPLPIDGQHQQSSIDVVISLNIQTGHMQSDGGVIALEVDTETIFFLKLNR